ncbi:MAG: hypothetical protein RLZZ15_4047 [Verrucomicrobiota bacterium]
MKRLLVLLLLPAALFAQDWAPNLTATATWQDNLSHADRAADRVSAMEFSATVLAPLHRKLGERDSLRLTPRVSGRWTPRFSREDWLDLGATAGWHHAFATGDHAPMVGVEFSAARVWSREWRREGTTTGAALFARRPLGKATRLGVRADFTSLNARSSVFDREAFTGTVELSRELDATSRLTLTGLWRDGDELTHSSTPRPDLAALAAHTAALTTFGRPILGYALRAHAAGASLAWAQAIEENTAVVFRYEWTRTRRQPITWDNHAFTASAVRQF